MKAGFNPDKVVRIPCTKDNIFRYWLEFLLPFHSLTGREMDVATSFLKTRHELSKSIIDKELLDKTLMTEEFQRKVREDCGVVSQHFQVLKNKLRGKKFFVDGKINPRLIPNIKEENDNFKLLLVFDYKK